MTQTIEINTGLHFRKPDKNDGAAVWELIQHTGVLDLNSSYSYIMWCDMFSDTSVVAVEDEKIIGFISGFVYPDKPNTLFIWQVAVHEAGRGKGLGTRMLFQLLNRESSKDVTYVEATVSPSNTPSQNLFKGLAKKLDTNYEVVEYYSSDDFPTEGHEDEPLFKIGPILEDNKILKE
ncbi:diaminobutyrate acetyltransferase [Virgibacillus ainsalahensis]